MAAYLFAATLTALALGGPPPPLPYLDEKPPEGQKKEATPEKPPRSSRKPTRKGN